MQAANLALRFLLELCALAALGYWGLHTGTGPIAKGLLAVGAPFLAALLWGLFVAPRSTVSVPANLQVVLGLIILGIAASSLGAAGKPILALIFGLTVAVNTVLMFAWGQ